MVSPVVVRPYSAVDLEPCRELWAELTQSHRELYQDPTIGGQDPGRYFDQHLARVGAERIWVADAAGEVVGLFGLIVEGEQAELEPLVVATRCRGQGIGRLLVDRAIEEAERLGVRFFSVKPVARNIPAIHFYYRAGFQTLGEIEMFMELRPGAYSGWRAGPELFGCAFGF